MGITIPCYRYDRFARPVILLVRRLLQVGRTDR
jgi:hypothetical protein